MDISKRASQRAYVLQTHLGTLATVKRQAKDEDKSGKIALPSVARYNVV